MLISLEIYLIVHTVSILSNNPFDEVKQINYIRTVYSNGTGCHKSRLPERDLNISAISQQNTLKLFLFEREMFQVLFDITTFHMNCSKSLSLTSIQHFSLFRMSLKTFCNVCSFMALISFSIVLEFTNIFYLRFVHV